VTHISASILAEMLATKECVYLYSCLMVRAGCSYLSRIDQIVLYSHTRKLLCVRDDYQSRYALCRDLRILRSIALSRAVLSGRFPTVQLSSRWSHVHSPVRTRQARRPKPTLVRYVLFQLTRPLAQPAEWACWNLQRPAPLHARLT